MSMIYHITLPAIWEESKALGTHSASSLVIEGFIHCSTYEQVEGSLNRFYRGASAVVVLEIDPALLTSELKYEPAHDELFPHIYGILNLDAVVATHPVISEPDGSFRWP